MHALLMSDQRTIFLETCIFASPSRRDVHAVFIFSTATSLLIGCIRLAFVWFVYFRAAASAMHQSAWLLHKTVTCHHGGVRDCTGEPCRACVSDLSPHHGVRSMRAIDPCDFRMHNFQSPQSRLEGSRKKMRILKSTATHSHQSCVLIYS